MHVMEEACQGTEQGAPHQPPEILRHLCPLSRISSKMSTDRVLTPKSGIHLKTEKEHTIKPSLTRHPAQTLKMLSPGGKDDQAELKRPTN